MGPYDILYTVIQCYFNKCNRKRNVSFKVLVHESYHFICVSVLKFIILDKSFLYI